MSVLRTTFQIWGYCKKITKLLQAARLQWQREDSEFILQLWPVVLPHGGGIGVLPGYLWTLSSYKLSVSFRIRWNLQLPSFIWYYYTYFNLWAPKSNITWLISHHGLFQGVRKSGPHRGNNTQHRNENEENCEGGIKTYPWGYDVAWQRSVTQY